MSFCLMRIEPEHRKANSIFFITEPSTLGKKVINPQRSEKKKR